MTRALGPVASHEPNHPLAVAAVMSRSTPARCPSAWAGNRRSAFVAAAKLFASLHRYGVLFAHHTPAAVMHTELVVWGGTIISVLCRSKHGCKSISVVNGGGGILVPGSPLLFSLIWSATSRAGGMPASFDWQTQQNIRRRFRSSLAQPPVVPSRSGAVPRGPRTLSPLRRRCGGGLRPGRKQRRGLRNP